MFALSGGNAQAHVYCRGGMSQSADGNKIHASVGIGADVFEIDAAGALEWNAAVGFAAPLNCGTHIRDVHVVEQDGFGAKSECVFEFRKRAHFNFDRLRTPAVAMRALKRILDSPSQRDVVVLDEHTVGE